MLSLINWSRVEKWTSPSRHIHSFWRMYHPDWVARFSTSAILILKIYLPPYFAKIKFGEKHGWREEKICGDNHVVEVHVILIAGLASGRKECRYWYKSSVNDTFETRHLIELSIRPISVQTLALMNIWSTLSLNSASSKIDEAEKVREGNLPFNNLFFGEVRVHC